MCKEILNLLKQLKEEYKNELMGIDNYNEITELENILISEYKVKRDYIKKGFYSAIEYDAYNGTLFDNMELILEYAKKEYQRYLDFTKEFYKNNEYIESI